MATVIKLPVFIDVPNWTEVVTIEGRAWTLRFHWNPRAGFWFVHLADELGTGIEATSDGEPIRGGQKLIPILGDADSDEALRKLAADDVLRGDPPGTSAATLGLFPGVFPGLLWAFAGAPLRHELADLTRMEILYADADALAQLRAAVEAAA